MSPVRADLRPWTKAEDARFRRLYPCTRSTELPAMFGRTLSSIRNRAANLHLRKDPAVSMHRPWSKIDDAILREIYPDMPTKDVAARLRRSICSVNGHVHLLGLNKSAAYMESPAACRLRRGDQVGKAYRFPKGHIPANKGLRRPGWNAGRMKETQFKEGQPSRNWRPIGSTRLVDGYVYRKVSDTRHIPWTRNWSAEHILIWEAAHGPLDRRTHCLRFKNGNRQDTRIENLELISRRSNMKRNSVHNLPKPIAETVQLLGALKRKINRRARREEQDRRSA